MNNKVRLIGIIIMAVAVVFLVRRFLSFQVDFSKLFSVQTLPYIVLVTVAVMVTLLIGSISWTIWLSFFSGQKVPILATFSIYARSNIAKYLPGNVGHYAMRQLYGASLGVKQTELLFSSILEIFCMAITAFILSFLLARDVIFTFLSNSFQRVWVLPLLIVVIVVIVAGVGFFLRKKKISVSEILSHLKKKEFRISLISVLGLIACNMAIYGVILLVLLRSHTDIGSSGLLIISAGIVSWFAGFITPGAPGGIGVREAVMVLMLSPIISEDIVLYVAVVQRVAYIFSDVFTWVIGKAIFGTNSVGQ